MTIYTSCFFASLQENNAHINRPFRSTKNSHFQNEATCKMFLVKIRFICMRIKNDLQINGFTLGLALKQRLGATRKRPIVLKAILRLRSFPGSFPTRPKRGP